VKSGTVYLVGAGPGDPALITRRGLALLRACDVVVHDYLCHPELLREVRPGAEVVFAGKGSGESWKQADLNALLVARARAGRSVVRLKGGDPCVFGRGGEEAEFLAAHGVPFEFVPGVSSLSAVPAYAGIPLTHRDCCSELLVVTGHVDPAKGGEVLDYARLASFPGTRVLLMGVGRLRAITDGMLAAGADAALPAAVVQWGTYGRQRTVTGTLADIAHRVGEARMSAPCVILFGGVVERRDGLAWFEGRPLFGRRVVVTRPDAQADGLVEQLMDAGAEVVRAPMIDVRIRSDAGLRDAAARVCDADWAVFTSLNGWRAFAAAWGGRDRREAGRVRFAVVGPRVAEAVRAFGWSVACEPVPVSAGELADALLAQGIAGRRIVWWRGNLADARLAARWREASATVEEVTAYETHAVELDDATRARVMEPAPDWVLFASGSAARAWSAANLGRPPGARFASIGPSTSAVMRELGLPVDAEAGEPSDASLVAALSSLGARLH
jgi:uroporphyrinogen III methyltransferase/synthase